MKLRALGALGATIAGILFAALAGGEDAFQVKVNVAIANAEKAPLRILGIKLPERVGDPPQVLVENVSPKPIVTFWVNAAIGKADRTGSIIMAVDDGPTSSLDVPGWERLPNLIPPEGKAEAREGALRSTTLAYSARDAGSNCLHVAAFVSAVDFADGTSWHQSWPQIEHMWKKSLPSRSATSCPQPAVQETVLQQLAGTRFLESAGPEAPAVGERVASYTFSCAVRQLQGRLTMACPF